ncbi:hypothetical protein ACVBE9_10395 [Eionea flava]
MFFFNRYSHRRPFLLVACLLPLLVSCAQTPNATTSNSETNNDNDIVDTFNVDSTVYFENKKSSASLRASFIQRSDSSSNSDIPSQQLNGGYQLQFRTILKGNNVIDRASIIAGGQRISLITTPLFIHPQKGLTVRLKEKDTIFIRSNNDATLRFSLNGASHLMRLSNDKLSEFILIK